MSTPIHIKHEGQYVMRFDPASDLVKFSNRKQDAKKFTSNQAARDFIQRYSDSGHQLRSAGCTIITPEVWSDVTTPALIHGWQTCLLMGQYPDNSLANIRIQAETPAEAARLAALVHKALTS